MLIYGPLFAESFTVEFVETSISGKPNDELVAEAVIKNLNNDLIAITIVRESNDLPDNWASSLCLKYCLNPSVSTINDSILADSSLDFSIHIYTDSIPDEAQIKLSFTLADNSEKIEFVIEVSTISTGLVKHDIENKSIRLKGNYPNPFNSYTIIEFEAPPAVKKAIIFIYNINGSLVHTQDFHFIGGGLVTFRFNVGHTIASGNYFYYLQVINANQSYHSTAGKFILIR